MNINEALPLRDRLIRKVYAFGLTIWREKWKDGIVQDWLSNFNEITPNDKDIEVNLLYLLSKFMFFGDAELRQLLVSLYRDLYKYPIVENIRKANCDTTDIDFINQEFDKELKSTRFIGVQEPNGSPSESGPHLLLPVRQECGLSTKNFINTSDIFKTEIHKEKRKNSWKTKQVRSLADTSILNYIFIDDICGGGTQVIRYLRKLINEIRKNNANCRISYFVLFGTEKGIKNVKKTKLFDKAEAVFVLDDTFKTFSPMSRYYDNLPSELINKKLTETMAKKYGKKLYRHPLGHGNCQLLLGLPHNTPNNTLPIFWGNNNNWKFIFKRYEKISND